MARVLTFSRVFPKYHPKAGQDTFFVEKILSGIMPKQQNGLIDLNDLLENVGTIINDFQLLCSPTEIKSHTIRAGNRWKVGDKFSPRVWSGKPYCSKQIIISPDIEVKKIWDVEVINSDGKGDYDIGFWVKVDDVVKSDFWVNEIAINDGLSLEDYMGWFNKPIFMGQVICWDENINY